MSAVLNGAAVHDISGLDLIERNLERLSFIDRDGVNYVFNTVLLWINQDLQKSIAQAIMTSCVVRGQHLPMVDAEFFINTRLNYP